MEVVEERDEDGPVQESPSVFHSTRLRNPSDWLTVFLVPLAGFFLLLSLIEDGEDAGPVDRITIPLVIVGFTGFGWMFFLFKGPGQIRMDRQGVQFSRMWYRSSTPWSNVRKVSWQQRNKVLIMEFVKTPFPWYQVYRWINMMGILSRNCIWLDDDRWKRKDLKSMAEVARRMVGQNEVGELPPEF